MPTHTRSRFAAHKSIVWPDFLTDAQPSPEHLLAGLNASQQLPLAQFHQGQARQLARLLRWAVENPPHYRELGLRARKLAALADKPEAFWPLWRELPLLSKQTLRGVNDRVHARSLPRDHLPAGSTLTSGSTGIPVEVRGTSVSRMLWAALTLREHLWHRRDFSKRLGTIRYRSADERPPAGLDFPTWNAPVANLYRTGPASVIHNGFPISRYVEWLQRFAPHYLLTYPSIASELLRILGGAGKPAGLEEIRFVSEPLDRELEARFRQEWGVRTTDIYSANEVGYLAFRCPEYGSLHVQAEAILVEILDQQGVPCAVGQQGRVVVTPLHNFATPLIRYELGDYATPGAPCACGRSLPVIEKVLGRYRNLLRTPDGDAYWPVAFALLRSVKPILQAQWIQISLDTIRLRLVLERPLSDGEREKTIQLARQALGYDFTIEIVAVKQIERGPTGKFEEFISLIDVT